MYKYKALNKQIFVQGEYCIVPIRFEDRMDIMKWRNEQMYHLRQAEPLTELAQDEYFNTVVKSLFDKEKPNQLLFSFLKNGICIGYGGLVHINWIDKNAEISFIMNTELEELFFEENWSEFLFLIEIVAFQKLKFHKLHTFAFNLRPLIYKVLENAFFKQEAILKEHCLFNGNFIDVIIHAKFNKNEGY